MLPGRRTDFFVPPRSWYRQQYPDPASACGCFHGRPAAPPSRYRRYSVHRANKREPFSAPFRRCLSNFLYCLSLRSTQRQRTGASAGSPAYNLYRSGMQAVFHCSYVYIRNADPLKVVKLRFFGFLCLLYAQRIYRVTHHFCPRS